MYIYEGCTTEEIRAYRALQNEPFDFGTGLITNENGGEEAYYEMHLECSEWDYLLSGFEGYGDEDIEYNKDMTRAIRRKNNWHKAIRKKKYGYMHLHGKPLNSLNKGKNFCSCSCCTPKTNPKGKRYFGSQKIKYKQRNWKHSDMKNIQMMDDKLIEYEDAYEQDRFEQAYKYYYVDLYDYSLLRDMESRVVEEIYAKDVYIHVSGSYWIDGKMFEYNKKYDVDLNYLHFEYWEPSNTWIMHWLDREVVDELEHFIRSKGLNIGCYDISQGRITKYISLHEQPWYSIYSDDENWIDGSYISIQLKNYWKMFDDDCG